MDLWSQQVTTTSFATVIGALAEIASANFSFTFSITTGIVKKDCFKRTRNKKKKYNRIVMLARRKHRKQII